MLTARQRQCFEYIRGYIDENDGISPSFNEIAAGLATTSKGGVHRLLAQLELRGKIRRLHNRARAITVIPEKPTAHAQVIPLVSYPNAKYFTWDDEAKALVPMQRRS